MKFIDFIKCLFVKAESNLDKLVSTRDKLMLVRKKFEGEVNDYIKTSTELIKTRNKIQSECIKLKDRCDVAKSKCDSALKVGDTNTAKTYYSQWQVLLASRDMAISMLAEITDKCDVCKRNLRMIEDKKLALNVKIDSLNAQADLLKLADSSVAANFSFDSSKILSEVESELDNLRFSIDAKTEVQRELDSSKIQYESTDVTSKFDQYCKEFACDAECVEEPPLEIPNNN